MKKKHKQILTDYEVVSEKIKNDEIPLFEPMTMAQLREVLMQISTILEEKIEENIYVISANSAKSTSNSAILVIELGKEKIYISGYAKVGLINQKAFEKVVSKLKNKLSAKEENPKKNIIKRIVFIVVTLLVIGCILCGINVALTMSSIHNYNIAVKEFNTYVDDYNKIASTTSVDNIEGVASSLQKLNIENESVFEAVKVVLGKNSRKKINKDTNTIYELITDIENSVQIIEQITAPSEKFVTERLKTVPTILEMQSVTKDNNPDGLLNKDGGYTSCIYFSSEKISQEDVPGKDIVSKGTDCGGAVEIYDSLGEANARCEYLSGFDGTVLYSGSYAIIGTMVIRTSYLLTNEEQLELTNNITKALTALK